MSKASDKLRKENARLRRENVQHRAEIKHLVSVHAEQQATIVALQKQLEIVKEQITLLKKAIFSPRRERFIPSPDQKLLFEPQSL